jgi:hypothetical protein
VRWKVISHSGYSHNQAGRSVIAFATPLAVPWGEALASS